MRSFRTLLDYQIPLCFFFLKSGPYFFSGPYFPALRLNMEKYSVCSPNAGKYGLEKLQIWTHFTQSYSLSLSNLKSY